jgi:hypothetical protein
MPVGVVHSLYQDPFSPILFNSPALVVTDEQKKYIKEILDTACSDSKFAEKAYNAIILLLTGGSVKVPTVTSLVPNSAEIGSASFTLHVHGTNLKLGSIIVFAGVEEPTTHVSDSELTTGVDMSLWVGPDAVPVAVKSPDGEFSVAMTFTFVDPAARSASKEPEKTYKTTTPTIHPVTPHAPIPNTVKK